MILGVLIGRFQLPHCGHEALINEALRKCNHLAILLGSYSLFRTSKNPFMFTERSDMLRMMLSDAGNVSFHPIRDYDTDTEWLAAVRDTVYGISHNYSTIRLFGYKKDESSYYLDKFPEYEYNLVSEGFHEGLSSTPLRVEYLRTGHIDESKVPEKVIIYLDKLYRSYFLLHAP